jgi:hypothetical protein
MEFQMIDYQSTLEKLQLATESMSESERASYSMLRVENERLQELLVAAQEIAEPESAYFTRG